MDVCVLTRAPAGLYEDQMRTQEPQSAERREQLLKTKYPVLDSQWRN